MTLSADLLNILVCPKCHSALEYRTAPVEELVCHTCRVSYRVEDGIPVMLIDEARPLDNADA
jgi:uncharacterized protein